MLKIKKFITFQVRKDGLMRIVDNLSVFGAVMVQGTKDRVIYSIGIYCEPDKATNCLDHMLMLSENGVWIRRVNIKYKLKG